MAAGVHSTSFILIYYLVFAQVLHLTCQDSFPSDWNGDVRNRFAEFRILCNNMTCINQLATILLVVGIISQTLSSFGVAEEIWTARPCQAAFVSNQGIRMRRLIF